MRAVDETVVAHFFDGPQDGVQLALPRAEAFHFFPRRDLIVWGLGPPERVGPNSDVYRLRGPALAGHAYYDYVRPQH
jgi:hypothetical protein